MWYIKQKKNIKDLYREYPCDANIKNKYLRAL